MELLNTTTHTAETKPTRVSFAKSPEKTVDSTPPTTPESCRVAGNTRADGTFHTDEATQHVEDDDFVNKKPSSSSPSKPLLRVNKILCRVPSHESNISDLSASLSPSYRTRRVVTDAKDESSIAKKNPIMSILSACGISGEISDLMNAHPNIGDGLLEKPNLEAERRTEKPVDWGLAPSHDEESVAKDYLNGIMVEKGADAAVESNSNMESDVSSSNASIEYDYVELVLDEAALIPPTAQVTGRRSPFSTHGILKNKLSGIVNGSNKTSSSKLEREASVSPLSASVVNELPNQSDSRISHTYDVASFQNEELRPAPLPEEQLATAASTAVDKGEERNASPVDSITGEVNHVVENVKSIKRSSKSSKSSKTSKGSKSSEASEKSVLEAESEEKKSKRFGLPSFKRNKKKEKDDVALKTQANQDDIITENNTESKINVAKGVILSEQHKSSSSTNEKPTKSRGLFFKKKKSQTQSTLHSDSIQTSPSDPSSTAAAAAPSAEVIADARFWKATLDSASSQTYYYHTKTKVTTWTKPLAFDEAQKNKLWKAAVDSNSGMTYYYHTKTKEVRWTKPEGFVERKKKKKEDVGETATATAQDVETAAAAGMEADCGLTKDVNKEDVVKANINKVMEINEQQATPPDSQQEEEITSDPTPVVEDSKAVESFAEKPSSQGVSQKEFQEEESTAKRAVAVDEVNAIEDAPFDELPLNPPAPREESPPQDEVVEDDTFSLPSITDQVVESTDMKSIDYSRSRTFASQMTDKTQRVNNTSATLPSKDFTNTQIAMNVNTDASRDVNQDQGLNPSSLDSALGHLLLDNPKNQTDSIISQVAAMPANDTLDDEDSDVFDEWDDEVSELSGIGNDEKVAIRKLLIERNARKNNKGMKDTRVDKSSTRNISSIQSSRDNNQTELDTFIAKDDWGSVSRYISEMRINRQHKVKQNQPSPSEIQRAIEHNRRVENNDNVPRKQIGAKSQMQHDDMEDESSQESPVDSDSRSRSTYSQGDTTYEESTFYDASTYYDDTTYDESTIEQSTVGQSSHRRRRAK